MWIVRWVGLLPPRQKHIARMPDSHSRKGAFSSFTPLPSFQHADVSHPKPHDYAASSTPAGFTVHLARLHLWLGPKQNKQVCLQPGHSHDPAVTAVSIPCLLTTQTMSGTSLQMTIDLTVKNHINISLFHIAS